jgi:prepilin-type N-terminal cleavage/methylation domain-containing protein
MSRSPGPDNVTAMLPAKATRGFTLIELAMVMLILAVLLAGMAIPLTAQIAARRYEETRRQMDEARDALLGFAAAHARLPCPAGTAGNGVESFAPGGDALNGNCSNFHDGFLPGASLGLSPLDGNGYVRDPWGTPANRIRYAVFGNGASVNGITNPLTRANGMQSATLAGLGAAPNYLWICTTAAGAGNSGCGPAANQLTKRAAFVVFSAGPNAAGIPAHGPDEARNLAGSPVFVSHETSTVPGNEFDDLVTWVPIHLLITRMVSAGRLP